MSEAKTVRLTMAQALIKFLKNQYVEHDGVETPFFAGCFGIFGHGCVAGVGEALLQNPDFRYYQVRNEQGASMLLLPMRKSRIVCRPLRASAPSGQAPPT